MLARISPVTNHDWRNPSRHVALKHSRSRNTNPSVTSTIYSCFIYFFTVFLLFMFFISSFFVFMLLTDGKINCSLKFISFIYMLCLLLARAGSVSVFGVGIGIRYFRRYFFHVGSVFGIGILKYLGIRYRYRYF